MLLQAMQTSIAHHPGVEKELIDGGQGLLLEDRVGLVIDGRI
jgi:hypothetical protein